MKIMRPLLLAALCLTSASAFAQPATLSPNTIVAQGIVPVASTSLETSHVLKASAGNLFGIYVVSTVAGFLMVFDAATVPSAGAVTPKECVPVQAGSVQFINYGNGPPEVFATGISAAFSTTGCLNYTPSSTAWFHGSVQ